MTALSRGCKPEIYFLCMQQSLTDPTASTNNQLQSEYIESSMRSKLTSWAEILFFGFIFPIVENCLDILKVEAESSES